jgi:hypothetical protein
VTIESMVAILAQHAWLAIKAVAVAKVAGPMCEVAWESRGAPRPHYWSSAFYRYKLDGGVALCMGVCSDRSVEWYTAANTRMRTTSGGQAFATAKELAEKELANDGWTMTDGQPIPLVMGQGQYDFAKEAALYNSVKDWLIQGGHLGRYVAIVGDVFVGVWDGAGTAFERGLAKWSELNPGIQPGVDTTFVFIRELRDKPAVVMLPFLLKDNEAANPQPTVTLHEDGILPPDPSTPIPLVPVDGADVDYAVPGSDVPAEPEQPPWANVPIPSSEELDKAISETPFKQREQAPRVMGIPVLEIDTFPPDAIALLGPEDFRGTDDESHFMASKEGVPCGDELLPYGAEPGAICVKIVTHPGDHADGQGRTWPRKTQK